MHVDVIQRPLGDVRAPGWLAEVAGGLLVAVLAAGLTWFVVGQDPVVGFAAVLLVAGSLWLATTRRTPLALALLMIYLGAFDGYLKLSIGSSLVTLIRDVLLLAIVVGLLVRAQADGQRLTAPPLSGWVGGFVVLVLVQLFNPNNGTLVHSLGGVRQHLEFVPLFFLTFAFVRTTRRLRIFVILLLLVAAANGLANWLQFQLTPQQLAAWGPGYAERVLAQGQFSESGRNFFDAVGNNYVRPFGLGSEVGAGGLVGAFAVGGVLALASLSPRLRYLPFAAVMAVGAVTAIVTSQGRAVVVGGVVIALAYGILNATSRGRLAGLLGLAAGGLITVLVAQSIIGGSGSSAFRYEGLGVSSIVQTTDDARGDSLASIPSTMAAYPLGAGLAVAGPASGAPGGTELTGVVDAETQFSFMTLETGVLGTLLLTAFTIILLGLGLLRCRNEPDREARTLLAAIIAPIAGMLALYVPSALTATTPGGPYLWAVGGIVAYWLVARPAARRRERLGLASAEPALNLGAPRPGPA